ncbi:MAG: ASKHA domain-containing protein [Chloroflexi bacterium]|nr:ASKHA domain-containing protein [Chloroflexota bacterium]
MSPLHHGDEILELVADQSIFDYADALNVRVPTSCGRTGECHECIIEVKRGHDALNPPTDAERFLLNDNYRLACQAVVRDPDADIEFAVLRRQPRIMTRTVSRGVPLDPLTTRVDDDVVFDGQVIDRYRGHIYGLAIDVGTTTVVLNLVDLESGEVVHTGSFENPQRFGGSDTMRRISYDGADFHGELAQVMLSSINFEIGDMARRLKVRRRHIYEAVIVGNTTMRELFFGHDVQSIGEKPYRSEVEEEFLAGKREGTALNVKARDLDLRIFPDANVYGAPLIGSHVGGDIAADLLAIGMDEQEEVIALVDIGTNTEVVVGNRHRLMAASCPAGPAFEGGEVTFGMPGYDGAIETAHITDGVVEYKTIGDAPPEGICGSGLVDLLAELVRTHRMNELGVLDDGGSEFEVVPEKGITLSRADMSALAQAKAANYCGQWIVLRKYGTPIENLSRLYLAGGFANYIDVENARDIGFIPNIPLDRVSQVGNAALEGATIMLISGPKRREIELLTRDIEHVELETTPDFFDLFVEGCQFKPMKQDLASA